MDKKTLTKIIEEYHSLGRRLQTYIDQLPESAEEEASVLEDAIGQIDVAIDDMESVSG
jgi:hypothetical protein